MFHLLYLFLSICEINTRLLLPNVFQQTVIEKYIRYEILKVYQSLRSGKCFFGSKVKICIFLKKHEFTNSSWIVSKLFSVYCHQVPDPYLLKLWCKLNLQVHNLQRQRGFSRFQIEFLFNAIRLSCMLLLPWELNCKLICF